jgi:hypothetical protein
MADKHVSIANQPLLPVAPNPELGAEASVVAKQASPLPSDHIVRQTTNGSDAPTRRDNYFVRHWRGNLSLPVSYWVNSFLATIAVSFVFEKLDSSINISDSPLLFATTRTLVLVLAITISIWQLVGVWRSAGKHRARGGHGFWAGAARFAVIIGFLGHGGTLAREAVPQLARLGEAWSIAFGDPDVGKHNPRIFPDRSVLEFVGGITFGVTAEVRKLLEAAPNIREIHLNSPGGPEGKHTSSMRLSVSEGSLLT